MMEVARRTTGMSGLPGVVVAAARSSFWRLSVDLYAVLAAASIPWSTSGVGIFMALWFIVAIPTLDLRLFVRALKRPAYWLPVAFFALALLGTLWADTPWPDRLNGINPVT